MGGEKHTEPRMMVEEGEGCPRVIWEKRSTRCPWAWRRGSSLSPASPGPAKFGNGRNCVKIQNKKQVKEYISDYCMLACTPEPGWRLTNLLW